MKRSLLSLGLVISLAGCELKEVTVPEGEVTLIVQSVIRTDLSAQFVFVERSLTGATGDLDPSTDGDPVTNATVVIRNLSNADDGVCSRSTILFPNPGLAGRYDSPLGCIPVSPGDSLTLTVTTPDGFRVTGQMRAPGAVGLQMFVNRLLRRPDPGDILPFDRETDSLRFVAIPRFGRGMDVNIESITGVGIVGNRLNFFVDDTTVSVPGDLLDVFELDPEEPGEPLFRAGRLAQVSVSMSDSNYFDFVRSANDPFSGQGFINKLDGGIGVFGGLETRTFTFRVTSEQEDPREGRYRLQGEVKPGRRKFGGGGRRDERVSDISRHGSRGSSVLSVPGWSLGGAGSNRVDRWSFPRECDGRRVRVGRCRALPDPGSGRDRAGF